MRVLVVSPRFPPDSSAATHRARLLVPHLARHGWTPTVLTVDPIDRDDALVAAMPPLDVVRVPSIPTRWTRPFGIGDVGLRALPALLARASLLARTVDAVFITIYPTYPALLGPWLRTIANVPFVLDYQDPWVGSWGSTVGGAANGGVDLKSRVSRAVAIPFERVVASRAAGFTAVSKRTFDDVVARHPDLAERPFAELPIGYDETDAIEAARIDDRALPFDPHDGLLHVCHVGTILPLARQPLVELLTALARVRDRSPALTSRLRVHFIGSSNQSEGDRLRVLPEATRLGVSDLVREHPARVPYFVALAAQQRAAANLVVGSTEPHYTASKIFPVLLARRPFLVTCRAESTLATIVDRAITNDDGWLHAFHASGARVDLLVAQLTSLLARALGPATRPDLDAIADASAPRLAQKLARLLDEVRCA